MQGPSAELLEVVGAQRLHQLVGDLRVAETEAVESDVELAVDGRRGQAVAVTAATTHQYSPRVIAGMTTSPRPEPIAVPPTSANGTSLPSSAAS